MKVNIILPHFGIKPSGGFKIVYEYANGLSKKGFAINIIHTASINGRLPWINYFFKIFKRIVASNKKWQYIDKKINMIYVPTLDEKYIPEADICIATAWQTAVYVNKYDNKKGKKFYLIQHYEVWNGDKQKVDKTWLYNMNKIVISKWLNDIGQKLGAKHMIHIPNALDHNKYKIINPIENRGLVVSMLYSEQDWKGSKDGIAALIEAKKYIPDLQAKLFGKPKAPSNLPQWIQYYENPKQTTLVEEIYNKSSIYLCTSWVEGWGLPPMEAMACGCAVITTNNGGVMDFAINNETALVCPIKQPSELAKCIVELSKSNSNRIRLANNGAKKVKEFTWEKSIDDMEKYILKNS